MSQQIHDINPNFLCKRELKVTAQFRSATSRFGMSEHPSSPVYQWINVPHLEAMLLQQGETDRKTSETGAESKKEPDRSQFSMMWDALKMGDWCENTRKAFSACVRMCVFVK